MLFSIFETGVRGLTHILLYSFLSFAAMSNILRHFFGPTFIDRRIPLEMSYGYINA
jgi:hypothetical protein